MIEGKFWKVSDRRTYLMGVLNVTPDSFSDGGQFDTLERALSRVQSMLPYIDILDIGGESTRPGATPVSASAEINRVVPVISALRQQGITIPISIDTTKAAVAKAAIEAGANVVNDVSAGRFDPEMLPLCAHYQVPVVLMHMQGEPRTMQINPQYQDVVREVKQFLKDAIGVALACGLDQRAIAIDPGIGFGKTLEHNLLLLRHLREFGELGCPVLVGVSRKSFIGKLCNQPDPQQRLFGTAAACSIAIANGANILRVHDTAEMHDVTKVADAIVRGY
jgi:dihydropteroate synthase